MPPPQWFTVQRFLVLSSLALIPFLAAIALLVLRRDLSISSLFPRLGFWAGTLWLIFLLSLSIYAVRHFTGFGFSSSLCVIVSIITIETGLVGVLTFPSFWKLITILPLVSGACLLLPWIVAGFISR